MKEPPLPPAEVDPSEQAFDPPAPPLVAVGGPLGFPAGAVPVQFGLVPPVLPPIPFPAVTVPRVSVSFAVVVANTATLESPGITPSSDVNPTS